MTTPTPTPKIPTPPAPEPTPANDNARPPVNSIIGDAEPEPAVSKLRSEDKTKPERVRTTPILGLHPEHKETQIEARYLGYVQGVRKEADERALVAQKEASAPVGAATKAKEIALAKVKEQRVRTEQEIKQKHRRALQKLKSLRTSRLAKAQNLFEEDRNETGRAFDDVVGPAAERLKVKLLHIANELGNKIVAAGKEFAPAMSQARAKRLQAEAEEKARKEREAEELAAVKALAAKAAREETSAA